MQSESAQSIFDRVVIHLLTQNARSINRKDCAYRGEGGLKCAVGCLIPDDLYDPGMEGNHVTKIMRDHPSLGLSEHSELLQCLQRIHDNIHVGAWPNHLTSIAEEFGLSPESIAQMMGAN